MRGWLLAVMAVVLLCCCKGKHRDEAVPSGNAVYYWRTSFALSDAERRFIYDNDIKALYVKFFDVTAESGKLRPDATLLFTDRFPEGVEIVPAVFIDYHAVREAGFPPDMATMIVARTDSMMTKNGYPPSQEIQIDFDWTASTRAGYFNLLEDMKNLLQRQGRRLSTTIRLHQLRDEAPPVDYGVLMMYNTGNATSPKEPNSILSMAAINPYLPNLKSYTLPLATALPICSWDLIFHEGQFYVIARGLNPNDTAMFRPVGGNLYMARRYMGLLSGSVSSFEGGKLIPGDIVRHESAPYALLDSVVRRIHEIRPSMLRRTILYHLDEKSINQYKDHEIQKIYKGG